MPETPAMPHAPRSISLNADSTALEVRLAARHGDFTGHTSGVASAHVQVNLAILPAALADDFRRFCELNPVPCPLLGVSEPGSPTIPGLGQDLDIRTDVPRYHIWRNGERVGEVTDLRAYWRDDLVTFALGCSFSFEHALLAEGIPLRHVTEGRNVAMYRTNIPTKPVGVFSGPTVVSMRPLKAADAIRAVQITARTPQVHGAPIHIGDPALIGIADIAQPDYGDAVAVHDDELPVFWACGVTPQAAIVAARPAFCITHAPGYMLVTDKLNSEL
ncbi:putative hydro-lyase [Herbaspirillum frisingense]|uniref:putative hydro-lyase n=1 Tax=Herbaspirillum frisingense TaxID=92645 RepID=UPI0016026C33|nr:putative hydro-lyase [Herbaspirillum frisingense]QNB08494.1 putative hydro-lyase [Herbaspirillum frisingense]